jgi:YfiH family protein
MEIPAPFREVEQHFVVDLPGARAVFSTRRGGRSEGPYRSLNLGMLTDDAPESVAHNRSALRAATGAPPLSFVHQVHGAEVLPADAAHDGGDPRALPHADGQVTDQPGVAMVALTADCLPVVIAGDGAAAMLHAGWRGLAGGVLEAGAIALRELGAGHLTAAIGPGAGPCCYEAGPEVHEPFADLPAAHRGANLDLKAIARARLRSAGVGEVYDIALCTMCSDPELLFSHRRDHGITGRQAGLAWLT